MIANVPFSIAYHIAKPRVNMVGILQKGMNKGVVYVRKMTRSSSEPTPFAKKSFGPRSKEW